MKNYKKGAFRILGLGLSAILLSAGVFAQQVQRAPFDVTDYKMDVQLVPDDNKLNATVDVSFTPEADTRTVSFELNGSLKVETITRVNSFTPTVNTSPIKPKTAPKPSPNTSSTNQITFVQDQAGVSDLGPSVRIDLGDTVTKGTPVTLRFKYSGVLATASGGPLLTKRLAYVGAKDGYLLYAARWTDRQHRLRKIYAENSALR
jgi:hypothetical protein